MQPAARLPGPRLCAAFLMAVVLANSSSLSAQSQLDEGDHTRFVVEVVGLSDDVLVGGAVELGRTPRLAGELLLTALGGIGSLSVLYGFGEGMGVYAGFGVAMGLGTGPLALMPRAGFEWPFGPSLPIRLEIRGFEFFGEGERALAAVLGLPLGGE